MREEPQTNYEEKRYKKIKRIRSQSATGLFYVREGLKTVFVGLTLTWYAVWVTVQKVPYLNNPAVAIVVGLILLTLTGRVNRLE